MKRFVHRSIVPNFRYPMLGLTLIELVIVCAIIAVLVGIVWVVMAPVREKARQVVCVSNLTQIGHAFRMYRDDWDGVEPQKGVQLEYWQLGLPPYHPQDKLVSYLRNKQVWFCPTGSLFDPPLGYAIHYCAHEDVVDPYLPPHSYDECPLIAPSPNHMASFKWAVSHVPDWPILLCYSHFHYFYSFGEWGDEHLLGLFLPDFSVRWFWTSELMMKLPVYQGVVPKN